MHQLFGGSRRDVSLPPPPPSHLRVHPVCRTTNCIIHHTRAIFAVIISAYARSKLLSSLSLSLSLCLPCPRSFAHLSGLLERSLIIAGAGTPAGEKRRGGSIDYSVFSRLIKIIKPILTPR